MCGVFSDYHQKTRQLIRKSTINYLPDQGGTYAFFSILQIPSSQLFWQSSMRLQKIPESLSFTQVRIFPRNRKMGLKDTLLMLLTMEETASKRRSIDISGEKRKLLQNQLSTANAGSLTPKLWPISCSYSTTNLQKIFTTGNTSLLPVMAPQTDIFRNPDDPDTFFEPNGKSSRGFNQIHINAFFLSWTDASQIF